MALSESSAKWSAHSRQGVRFVRPRASVQKIAIDLCSCVAMAPSFAGTGAGHDAEIRKWQDENLASFPSFRGRVFVTSLTTCTYHVAGGAPCGCAEVRHTPPTASMLIWLVTMVTCRPRPAKAGPAAAAPCSACPALPLTPTERQPRVRRRGAGQRGKEREGRWLRQRH